MHNVTDSVNVKDNVTEFFPPRFRDHFIISLAMSEDRTKVTFNSLEMAKLFKLVISTPFAYYEDEPVYESHPALQPCYAYLTSPSMRDVRSNIIEYLSLNDTCRLARTCKVLRKDVWNSILASKSRTSIFFIGLLLSPTNFAAVELSNGFFGPFDMLEECWNLHSSATSDLYNALARPGDTPFMRAAKASVYDMTSADYDNNPVTRLLQAVSTSLVTKGFNNTYYPDYILGPHQYAFKETGVFDKTAFLFEHTYLSNGWFAPSSYMRDLLRRLPVCIFHEEDYAEQVPPKMVKFVAFHALHFQKPSSGIVTPDYSFGGAGFAENIRYMEVKSSRMMKHEFLWESGLRFTLYKLFDDHITFNERLKLCMKNKRLEFSESEDEVEDGEIKEAKRVKLV